MVVLLSDAMDCSTKKISILLFGLALLAWFLVVLLGAP